MNKIVILFLLLFVEFLQITGVAQTSEEIPSIGGISFAKDGSLLRFNLSGEGQNIAVKNDFPLSFATGTGRSQRFFRVNRIARVSVRKQSISLLLSSSELPEASAVVELVEDRQSVKVTVKNVSSPLITSISVQFQIPEDFDCQLGFPPYSPFHHSCSNDRGTVAAFCITGNCDNTVQYDSTFTPRFGATLSRSPIQDLSNSSFIIFTSPHNHKTLAFLKDFSAFHQQFGNNVLSSSSLFFTSLPTVSNSDCVGKFLCSAQIKATVKLTRSLGFEETVLLGDIWARTTGEFDPRPNLKAAMREFRKNGVCPVLHTLASELHPYNPLCTPNAGNQPGLGGANYRCPTNAAKLTATGQQFINGYGSFYLWDGNKREVFDSVVNSYVKGLTDYDICGLYADGADWFGEVQPQLGQIYLAEMSQNAPKLRLRAAIAGSPNALHVRDADWADIWQIRNSHTPKDWTFNWGYPTMQGWFDHFGIAGRLGWIPPPNSEDTIENYLPMLNAAVATGSFITLETSGDDASLISPKFNWFRTALQETIGAVKEIRAGGSEGMPVTRTARYDLTHFSNGVSTVALFDSIIPAAEGSKLDGRSYGVKFEKGSICRNEKDGCFYFKGTPRMPSTPNTPRLADGGSFIFAPGDIATKTQNFTLTAWLKAETANFYGGIFEKATMGYGLYYFNGSVGGHTTGKIMGSFYNNPYFKIDNPQTWNHFVYSFDAQKRRFKSYLNGELVLDSPLNGSLLVKVFADSPVFVGTNGDSLANFRGWLDDVKLYDRAITDAEAIAISKGNSTVGNPVISWSAGNSSPPKTLDIKLETQRVVYLVPMLEGTNLPPGKIRLNFNGFRGKTSSAKIITSIKYKRIKTDANQLILEIDTKDVGIRLRRVAVITS